MTIFACLPTQRPSAGHPANEPELIANLEACLRGAQRNPTIVRNYFRAESVQYAAG